MTDGQEALNNQGGAEATATPTPGGENRATGNVVEATAGVTTNAGEQTTETGGSSKGAQARIRELNQRAKDAEQRAQAAEGEKRSLAEKVAALTGSVDPTIGSTPNYTPQSSGPIVNPGEEIDPIEFNRRMQIRDQNILRQTQGLINFQNKVNKVTDNINKAAQKAVAQYPQLNPNHESFDKEVSETVYEAVEAYVKTNPAGDIGKFIDKQMRPYTQAVDREVGQVKENLAKQVSQTALRPTSIRSTEKPFGELSIPEMEKKLGVVQT